MTRKRRKLIQTVRKSLPKVFICPNCGTRSVRIFKPTKIDFKLICGNCKISKEYESTWKEPIDIYNDFIDSYTRGEIS